MKRGLMFILLASLIGSAAAQGTSTAPKLVSCFQTIALEEGGSYDLLGSRYWFQQTVSAEYLVNIKTFDLDRGELPFHYQGISDINFDWYQDIPVHVGEPPVIESWTGVELIKEINGSFVFNTNVFQFGLDVSYVEITLLTKGPNGQLYPGQTTTLNIKGLGEVMTLDLENKDDSCQTFENFHVDYTLDLPGFCGEVNASVSKHPKDVNDPNDPNNDQEVRIGQENMLDRLDDHCIECVGVGADPNYPKRIPCGCNVFIIDFSIIPCTPNSNNCPDMHYITVVEVCCSCDIRHKDTNG